MHRHAQTTNKSTYTHYRYVSTHTHTQYRYIKEEKMIYMYTYVQNSKQYHSNLRLREDMRKHERMKHDPSEKYELVSPLCMDVRFCLCMYVCNECTCVSGESMSSVKVMCIHIHMYTSYRSYMQIIHTYIQTDHIYIHTYSSYI